MKIFPLRPMSNYDKFNNFMKIVENSKHAHTIPVSEKIVKVVTSTIKENSWTNILGKYCNKISEKVKGIQKNHG